MVTLSVSGGGCWRKEDGWPWLRIREQHNRDSSNKGRLVLDKCLLRKGSWKKELQVELQGHMSAIISFELWVGGPQATDFLQFVTGWSVDLTQWIQSGAARRWYKVQKSIQDSSSEVVKGPEFWGNEAELQRSTAYVCVNITGVKDPDTETSDLPQPDTTMVAKAAPSEKSPFQFVLPHRSLTRSGKLRAVRVGQIVHELRTDILHELLPLTLYGHTTTRHHQRASTNRSQERRNGIAKALMLLQLSCQYANYCVDELNRYASKLEKRTLKLKGKTSRVKHRHKLLKEQKVKLKREAEVLSCSLDGMQSLLEKLDPETLARLQVERSSNLET
ncbi:hypothetical protein PC128_g3545 [Phytophthora cactorum]|nr:hypothetical protein PC120_g4815 [Phytophthora cactorum]KAG3090585.1 hypothetical protein PC121_g4058 [Phytophthora cactorum]KAG3201945.1 hypothetical protein PC128_g3545 [Phytophthora cactorum]KAG4060087.1 hypothetical protein PC123_g5015 [Phytophthora cactorum]